MPKLSKMKLCDRTKKGADIVSIELHVEVSDLQWYRYTKAPKDYHFLKHFLAINDFRILITQACLESPIQLIGFIPEYMGEKTVQGNVKKYIRDKVCDVQAGKIEYSHTPDAAFALAKNESTALFFLEVDRGIEVIRDPERGLLKAVLFYLNYVVVKYMGDTFLDLSYEKQPGHPHKTCSPVPPEGLTRKCLSAGRVESIAV